jgi:hypothetical protein
MILEMIGLAPRVEYDLLNTPVVKQLGLCGRSDFIRYLLALPQQVKEAMSALS